MLVMMMIPVLVPCSLNSCWAARRSELQKPTGGGGRQRVVANWRKELPSSSSGRVLEVLWGNYHRNS